MGATTPVYRGMCATTPKKGHASRRVLAATRHTATVASITRRRAEQAGRLGDLAKMALPIRLWHPSIPAHPAPDRARREDQDLFPNGPRYMPSGSYPPPGVRAMGDRRVGPNGVSFGTDVEHSRRYHKCGT